MVYVHPNNEEFCEDIKDFDKFAYKRVEKKQVIYQARDGLTAPTKDVVERFFRKKFPFSKETIRETERDMVNLMKEMGEKNESQSQKSKKSQKF